MEIAVQEFSGYSSRDNNHIYDLVVSLRVLKTVTDARTPTPVVIAGVQHMLERALVLQGLALLGHPGAAAFEVVVQHVGGLIDATRDESQEKVDGLKMKLAEAADNITVLKREFEATKACLRTSRDNHATLIRQYNAVVAKNEELRAKITRLTSVVR